MLDDGWIRPKRQGQGIWRYECKLYIPCPVGMKAAVARIARENGMSQAELGLVVMQEAIDRPGWLGRIIKAYFKRQGGRDARAMDGDND